MRESEPARMEDVARELDQAVRQHVGSHIVEQHREQRAPNGKADDGASKRDAA